MSASGRGRAAAQFPIKGLQQGEPVAVGSAVWQITAQPGIHAGERTLCLALSCISKAASRASNGRALA
ncbi:hypothetical protein [Intestinirhabdus alba]|uniref:Uncharacterized protein n=1 Tax=Intestinirhabdus alba TaxID=2899544 RepID=A0A6L6IKA8_9ENTR|nr:hypothetical protein [Intestinirhabdus alba]MTH47292.1 hypothetical protein [Intestinirhabdus alba]